MKISIRPARWGEMPAIISLISHYPKELIQKPLPKLRDFFVAVHGEIIVGCCALEIYSRKIAEIRSLAVASHYGGRRIGSRLVSACVRRARSRRVREVLVITESDRLFSRLGFRPFHKQKFALFRVF
ncbi:MAG: hypothetical protein A2722_03595 [Candidatus Doudnabacteria bacterium RIFCSPHIGHO2_01_FULL_50_11]|uniref:N-acetyltransferase domain-containing protein n=1 Tax=Candidatus Doudnabacteria bacterium RIFCSPHIGHO2_01_FULL_50_11 TaxID=1817828 RepID=A0A1F5PIW3_9BACT|nr:MAG: hypothetical protein A2722_03595 [Candidatus Doudnabacteria bacterium RIFCSPHIGHO2_01_FULL_50_11]HLC44858.1 GNAT family N-acetyltransferase [Patescibacteria group bacterium]